MNCSETIRAAVTPHRSVRDLPGHSVAKINACTLYAAILYTRSATDSITRVQLIRDLP